LIASSVLITEPSYYCSRHAFPMQYRGNAALWRIEMQILHGNNQSIIEDNLR
jgi:hypothetical protein